MFANSGGAAKIYVMGKKFFPPEGFDDDDLHDPKQPTKVVDLPYYETLRTVLEPYLPADDEASSDKTFTTTEIIRSIEEHHGVFQGVNGKYGAEKWVEPEDFTRAMQYLGFKAANVGGVQLEWLLKKKD